MSHAVPQRDRLPAGRGGLALALLALMMQLAAISVVPFAASDASMGRLVAASICHGDGGKPAPHRTSDCAVCPLCQAIAHVDILLGTPVAGVVTPVLLAARAFAMPPSRAVPGRATFAFSARGPPAAD